MHILFLSDNFPPEVNAPASRTFEHCREWVKAGVEVTVITCAPNFPKGVIYQGYRNRVWQRETIDGVRVIRVWSYVARNEGFARRVADYASYMLMATLAAPFVRKVDVVVGTSPQFFTACAAYMVSRLKRVPFVFELRDFWPESIEVVGALKKGIILNTLEKIEMFLYRRADRIVTVTHSFKTKLGERGIDTGKVAVVTNGVDGERFSARPKDPELVERYNLHGAFVAGYVGTHGMAHALDTLMQAAEGLKEVAEGRNIRLLFVGDGAAKSRLVEKQRELRLDNVTFIDSVNKDVVARYWSLLDVSIIHLKKAELFSTVIPSKLFECMAMGIPIVHGVTGESAEIVRRYQVGLTFEPEDAADLRRRLVELSIDSNQMARLRSNCVVAAKEFDRSRLALEMLGSVHELVDRHKLVPMQRAPVGSP